MKGMFACVYVSFFLNIYMGPWDRVYRSRFWEYRIKSCQWYVIKESLKVEIFSNIWIYGFKAWFSPSMLSKYFETSDLAWWIKNVRSLHQIKIREQKFHSYTCTGKNKFVYFKSKKKFLHGPPVGQVHIQNYNKGLGWINTILWH